MASFSGLEVALQEAERTSAARPLQQRKSLSLDMTKTPTKTRSISDSTPALSPSPQFKEPASRSQDDHLFIATPSRGMLRPFSAAARGNLSIQMPARDPGFTLTEASARQRQDDAQDFERENYSSPSSVLPRHSRGLDFSRACTSLHHSTLAESSPASSPTITQKAMMIPRSRRSSTVGMGFDARMTPGHDKFAHFQDKSGFFPRSYGSTTALTSDASSSSSDDDELMRGTEDADDAMVSTPQMKKMDSANAVTPFGAHLRNGTTPQALRSSSPMNFHHYNSSRGRVSRHGPRHGSFSVRTHGVFSSAAEDTPRPAEYSSGSHDEEMQSPMSRRGSISFGTGSLHISTGDDSNEGDNGGYGPKTAPPTPSVVRRAVTRRSNLLPKTKGFARIRAALLEESAPIDSEANREAEIVRQVRVKDVGEHDKAGQHSSTSASATSHPSSDQADSMSDVDALGIHAADTTSTIELTQANDNRRASSSREFWPHLYAGSSTGNNATPTPPPPPPPPLFHRHRSSSGMSLSEDTDTNSPRISHQRSSRSESSTSTHLPESALSLTRLTSDMAEAGADNTVSNNAAASAGTSHFIAPSRETAGFHPPAGITQADVNRKVSKRRRDDDFDISSLKRRAVSPGMASVHSSPNPGQSPASTPGNWPGGLPPPPLPGAGTASNATSSGNNNGNANNNNNERGVERTNSAASNLSDTSTTTAGTTPQQTQQQQPQRGSVTPLFGPKRVGFQGMTDTSDGMMKMSID